MDLDYAVIGGGVAGTYAAWRLAESGRGAVGLFECSDRIGGRLYSVRLPGMPNIPGELGGMRFMPQDHKMVAAVVGRFGLETRDFPMGDDRPLDPKRPDGPKIGRSRNILHLRGRRFTEADFADPGKVPYMLLPGEAGLSPTELQFRVMQLLAGDRDLTEKEWFDLEVFGEPLYKIGYWNLLSRVLSAEAYAFMRDAGGYVANTANTNSVYQLPATEYGDTNVLYLCLKDGFQALPLTLARAYAEASGRAPEMGSTLIRIEGIGEGYRLHFRKTSGEAASFAEAAAGEGFAVTAKHVVLAMPRRALELIDWPCWQSDLRLRCDLDSVVCQTAFKLLLGFEVPWWRALGLMAGRSITDLPLRQTYYMASEADFGSSDGNQSALLLASYNDMSTVPFWRGLEHTAPFEGRRTRFTGDAPAVPDTPLRVTGQMIDAAVKQLAEMHGLNSVPAPHTAVYHDWSDDPYGGGWHEWRAGYRYSDIIPRMLRPVDTENVMICGEAYSRDQGWVEGALDTAETMLQRCLKLDPPPWIDRAWTPDG
jgi:monoamine oxidase